VAEGDDVTLPELARRFSRLEQSIDRKLDSLMESFADTSRSALGREVVSRAETNARMINELRQDVDELSRRSDCTDGILLAFRWAIILLGAFATVIAIATALGKWPA
jgi:hypothetical protein